MPMAPPPTGPVPGRKDTAPVSIRATKEAECTQWRMTVRFLYRSTVLSAIALLPALRPAPHHHVVQGHPRHHHTGQTDAGPLQSLAGSVGGLETGGAGVTGRAISSTVDLVHVTAFEIVTSGSLFSAMALGAGSPGLRSLCGGQGGSG